MGISGLLPLLKSIQKPCNLRQFAGQTLGVDAYGWLHRGTVACAIDLALGKPTTNFVDYAMHRVRMLIHFGITPYLVFDGDYLPSKAGTESDRNRKREESRKQGLELLKLGKSSQAHLELQKAVDVTPEMARQLIDELKILGIKYVVAPYEADAQLVYLEKKGIINGILSEDSDLLVFGARCLLTKLDQYGECIMINRNDFAACKEINLVGWSDAEFRRMTILSGCDYLPSINKMGLKTAYRLVRKHKSIERILRAVQFDGQFHVPPGYRSSFEQAERTFLHQHVFCPITEAVVCLTELGEGMKIEDLPYVGKPLTAEIARGVANGDLHPMTKAPIIIPNVRRGTAGTPFQLSRNKPVQVTPVDDLKKKPIDSFFKPKRTPLAELDPNSFTPSPSQERLMSGNRSWIAQSAPGRQSSLASDTPVQISRVQPPSSAPFVRPMAPFSSGSVRSSKRARLCTDGDDSSPSVSQNTDEAKSPFFSPNVTETPSAKKGTFTKGRRRTQVNLWSDDSIEDAMADLPDIGDDGSLTTGPKRVSILKDVEPLESPYPSPPCSETITSSQVRSSTGDSASSRGAENSDTAGQLLDKHISADLKALKTKFSYTPQPRRALAAKTGVASARSSTPLQRLGLSALRRPSQQSNLEVNMARERIMTSQEQEGNGKGIELKTPVTPPPTQMASIAVQGSEDCLVPDSEEEFEADGELASTAADAPASRKLDLSGFLFTAS